MYVLITTSRSSEDNSLKTWFGFCPLSVTHNKNVQHAVLSKKSDTFHLGSTAQTKELAGYLYLCDCGPLCDNCNCSEGLGTLIWFYFSHSSSIALAWCAPVARIIPDLSLSLSHHFNRMRRPKRAGRKLNSAGRTALHNILLPCLRIYGDLRN